jgi:hypothetical protein
VSSGFGLVTRYLRTAVPMWVGTIFVVAGTLASIGSVGEWREARRFGREAVTAQGAVVATSLEAAARDGNQSTRYLLTYRFTPANGAEREQTEEIPLEVWETYAAGDDVSVRYLPDDPATARTRSPTPEWVPPLIAAVTAAFAVLGVLIARPGWRRLLVLLRVLRNGATAEAVVTEVAPAGVVVNRVPQWRLKYEFRDRHGERHEGESDYMRPHEAAEWHAGDPGTVRYDRERAAHNVWLGRA